jgi:hypothetical protein
MNGLSSTALQNTDKLGAADRIIARRQFGGALDDAAHGGDRVHVQPGPGRADIDRSANPLGRGQRLRHGGKKIGVDSGHAFFDMRRKAADEIHVDVVRGAVERFGKLQQMFVLRAPGNQRHRRHRDPVVDDRQSEFLGNLGTHLPQVACRPLDLFVHITAERVGVLAHAIKQADADRDGADVELLGPHHGDGFENLLAGEVELSHGPLVPGVATRGAWP